MDDRHRFDLGPILPAGAVRTIEREELQRRLVEGTLLRLVMCLPEWEFRAKRIPGSVRFDTPAEMQATLRRDDEIVVILHERGLPREPNGVRRPLERGYSNVRRYGGGLTDWEEAGLPLDGTRATAERATPGA